eukprot:ANDGO_04235.mRNA.1 Stress-response A/B barrel domain-containing protein UP3
MATVVEHLVLFKPKVGVTAAELQELQSAIEGMNGRIAGTTEIAFRESFTTARNQGYTHVLRCLCDSKDALEEYARHPVHVQVKSDHITPLAQDLIALDILIDKPSQAKPNDKHA